MNHPDIAALAAAAERLDQQQRDLDRAVDDINFRAQAAGTHLHDQWQARLADFERQAHAAADDDDTDGM